MTEPKCIKYETPQEHETMLAQLNRVSACGAPGELQSTMLGIGGLVLTTNERGKLVVTSRNIAILIGDKETALSVAESIRRVAEMIWPEN